MDSFLTIWNELFCNKINNPTLGIFRIFIGIICLLKLLLLFNNRYDYFSAKGFYPYNVWKNYWKKHISIFHYLNNVDIIFLISAISFLSMTLGFCTELSCFFSYFLLTSLNNRNPFIFNSGDSLLRIMLFLLIFSNCGFYISIDNVIYNRNQLELFVNPLFTRLMQIVIIKVYVHAFYAKLLFSDFWLKGTGFYYSMSHLWVARYNINPYLNKFMFIFLNYATLAAESLLALGLLFNETSTICVFLLIFMHLLFEIFLRINLFGIVMIACLFLFLRIDMLISLSHQP